MKVIPVLDIRQGRAVHAVAGDRRHYGPLRSVLHGGPDPFILALAGRDTWKLDDLYLADLDAILGEAAPNLPLYRDLRGLGLDLWVDAGVRDVDDLPPLLEAGVTRVVVGLETVRGPAALSRIVETAGATRVAFSLDLRDGRPMVETLRDWETEEPSELARQAIAQGVRTIIRLDLARVGTGRGVGDLSWITGEPDVDWYAGGGVAGSDDLRELARNGASGALVGSALHDGRIRVGDLEVILRARSPRPERRGR